MDPAWYKERWAHPVWGRIYTEESRFRYAPGEVDTVENRFRKGLNRLLESFLEMRKSPKAADGSPANNQGVSYGSSMRLRPSSASANLQTEVSDDSGGLHGRPMTGGSSKTQGRPRTQGSGPKHYTRINKDTLGEENRHRRLTLGAVDGVGESESIKKYREGQQRGTAVGKKVKGKLEELINIGTLDVIKHAFAASDEDGNGELDLDEFKALLKEQLKLPMSKEHQIESLFYKIDWSSDGLINWDEFCTYMQLEYAEKEDHYRKNKEVDMGLPATIKHTPHREGIVKAIDTSDGNFMVCSREGVVSFWTSNVTLKKHKLLTSLDLPVGVKNPRTKWISDMILMTHYNKIIVGTGDREIQFFELSTFEAYCQINSLGTVPLALDYNLVSEDHCIILFGDGDGCINILDIPSAGENLRLWKKRPKVDGMPTVGLDVIAQGGVTKFIRWQVHQDWIQQMKYFPEIRQVISCSNHPETALVIGSISGSTDVSQQLREGTDSQLQTGDKPLRQKVSVAWLQAKPRLSSDELIFNIYKGVKCFDFSKRKNVLVTGGMDRMVRMWNPYMTAKPIALLRGHSKPITYLAISEEDDRIFSISTDKTIRVWDILDQNCLTVVRPKAHKIKGEIQACCYSNISKTIMIATDQMNGIPLKQRHMQQVDIPITHKEAIRSVVYNDQFEQILTCSDASIVKLWDLDTGSAIFEFGDAHGSDAVTSMIFDKSKRRLITSGRDGCVRIWNYNNGHCLKTMSREKKPSEVSSIIYVEMSNNKYVISVGWDKNINIYNDIVSDTITSSVQHPQPYWSDDLEKGHKDDILSVATCPPNMLATSSYDGEIVVWNMVSGHIFCRLKNPNLHPTKEQEQDGELAVKKLVFLHTRAYQKDNASLVASGPMGIIHFWSVYNNGILRAQFSGCTLENGQVTTMETNSDNSRLFAADSFGFIYIWKIKTYAVNKGETSPPELEVSWRGHIENVTSLAIVEKKELIVSSSLDCTVRLWNFKSEYIGTFGQPDPWDVFNRATYQHPMVPYDVLVDPLSLPQHPVLTKEQEPLEDEQTDAPEAITPTILSMSHSQVPTMNSEDIASKVKERAYRYGNGKRLRHEMLKPQRLDRGGPSEYQMLRWFDLETAPKIEPPKTSGATGKDLDFSVDLTMDDDDSDDNM